MFNFLTVAGALGFAILMILLFSFPLFAFFIAVGYFLMKEITHDDSDYTRFK